MNKDKLSHPWEKAWPENRVALLGGSFNPVHHGHLRLAIEILEVINPKRLDLIPCGIPPHKPENKLLPFGMRVEILKEISKPFARIAINTVEGERGGSSYTIDTLADYRTKEPEACHYFVMGGADFSAFHTWKNWQNIPYLANIIVAARAGVEELSFKNDALRMWQDAKQINAPYGRLAYALPKREEFKNTPAGHIIYMPLPRLDLSSSLIRERWLEGRSINFLTPDSVRIFLNNNENAVRRVWDCNVPLLTAF